MSILQQKQWKQKMSAWLWRHEEHYWWQPVWQRCSQQGDVLKFLLLYVWSRLSTSFLTNLADFSILNVNMFWCLSSSVDKTRRVMTSSWCFVNHWSISVTIFWHFTDLNGIFDLFTWFLKDISVHFLLTLGWFFN